MNLAYSSADEERDYESQTTGNQISPLVSRLRTRYGGTGWSVVHGLSGFVSFVALWAKNLFARRGATLRWLEKTRRHLRGAA